MPVTEGVAIGLTRRAFGLVLPVAHLGHGPCGCQLATRYNKKEGEMWVLTRNSRSPSHSRIHHSAPKSPDSWTAQMLGLKAGYTKQSLPRLPQGTRWGLEPAK